MRSHLNPLTASFCVFSSCRNNWKHFHIEYVSLFIHLGDDRKKKFIKIKKNLHSTIPRPCFYQFSIPTVKRKDLFNYCVNKLISFVFTEHSQNKWKKNVYIAYIYINMLNGSLKNLIQSNFKSCVVVSQCISYIWLTFNLIFNEWINKIWNVNFNNFYKEEWNFSNKSVYVCVFRKEVLVKRKNVKDYYTGFKCNYCYTQPLFWANMIVRLGNITAGNSDSKRSNQPAMW